MLMAAHPQHVEVVARFDDDDRESAKTASDLGFTTDGVWVGPPTVLIGPRIRNMTIYWNECFDACSGDIVCQANDDMVFRTPGWDVLVGSAFAEVEDKILMVHGNDMGGHFGRFGPHPFVSRRWVETVGYFIPPYFCSDNGDAWVNDLANNLGRRRYLRFELEHMHPAYGKAPMDSTYDERMQRHAEDHPDELYDSLVALRMADVEKLRAVAFSNPDTRGWVDSVGDPVRSVGKCPKCGSWSTVIIGKTGQYWCNCCGNCWERYI